MTPQQMFNTAYHGLAAQGFERSLRPGGGTCAYRGTDGKRCALGYLIPDEVYDPAWDGDDGKSACDLADMEITSSICDENRLLLMQLQTIHDGAESPDAMKSRLLHHPRTSRLQRRGNRTRTGRGRIVVYGESTPMTLTPFQLPFDSRPDQVQARFAVVQGGVEPVSGAIRQRENDPLRPEFFASHAARSVYMILTAPKSCIRYGALKQRENDMARIVKKADGKWQDVTSADGVTTYAGDGDIRFTIEVGTHRLELTEDEAADLFARAFDHSVKTGSGKLTETIRKAQERAHKELA